MNSLPKRYEPLGRLNVVCPYYTMFPLEFPFSVLRGARPDSRVLDPFCGRGTTLYAARLRGFKSLGIDSNPVAVAIAAAKLVSVSSEDVVSLAEQILKRTTRSVDLPEGDFWSWCYHPATLIEICILREYFLSRKLSDVAVLLRALILGLLHGPLTKGAPSYLSNQMPRTYATKPDAAVEFWERRGMRPRRVNALDIIRRRARYILEKVPSGCRSHVIRGDVRALALGHRRRFSHVITSPPYLGMRCYVSDQWLRNWFVGATEDVEYDESQQLGSNTREAFVLQLARVWRRVAGVCTKDATLVVRFGALPSVAEDPAEVVRHSLARSDGSWKILKTRRVPPPPSARRQANQFTQSLKDALKEVDVYARLDI
jgi:hypothetical protein